MHSKNFKGVFLINLMMAMKKLADVIHDDVCFGFKRKRKLICVYLQQNTR